MNGADGAWYGGTCDVITAIRVDDNQTLSSTTTAVNPTSGDVDPAESVSRLACFDDIMNTMFCSISGWQRDKLRALCHIQDTLRS